LGAERIEVSVYARENDLITEEDLDRDTEIVDIDALSELLSKKIGKTEQPVIIDGHYGHELLDPKQVNLLIILRKAPWILKETLQKREYNEKKVRENLEAEIMGIIAEEAESIFPRDKLHEVDTTLKNPAETVKDIIDTIRGNKPTNYEPIDWITYPETLRVLVNNTCTL
jgi:adenylate kinase